MGMHPGKPGFTRREALAAAGAALGAAAAVPARAEGGLLRATRVDHVSLAAGDINKAMLFYRRLFGNEVLKDNKTERRFLRLGPCYLAIAPAKAGESKRIDHAGIGIANFNGAALKGALEKAGFKVRPSNDSLYVPDPDGTEIQLIADESWKLTRNASADAGPKQEALWISRGMHHLAIQVSDMARSTEFYRKLFGEPTPGLGTPPQPTFQAGETRILLYNPAPNKPPKIDHFSVLVDPFDAPAALKVVQGLGANAQLSRQGTLNEFFDPDGIRLQVTFPVRPTALRRRGRNDMRAALIALALLFAAGRGFAFDNGREFVKECEAGATKPFSQLTEQEKTLGESCATYIRGFVGGIRVGEFRTGVRMICSPSGVEVLEAMRISLKWMGAHPDELDHPAVELIFRSLIDAFPCAKPAPPKPKEEKKKDGETVL